MSSTTGSQTDSGGLLDGIPPAPREPSARAKKLLLGPLSPLKQTLIFGIAFFVFGCGLTCVMIWGLPVDLFISLSSRKMSATISDAKSDTSITVRIFRPKHPTILTFEYDLGDVRYQGASATFDSDMVRSMDAGATVDIEVSRLYAGWSRVVGTTTCRSGFIGLFSLFFPCFGGGVIIYARRGIHRQMAAYRDGVPTVAKVVWSGRDLETSLGGENPYAVRWEFNVRGGVFSGEISSMSRAAIEDLMERNELPVLYDPRDPSRNTAYIP